MEFKMIIRASVAVMFDDGTWKHSFPVYCPYYGEQLTEKLVEQKIMHVYFVNSEHIKPVFVKIDAWNVALASDHPNYKG